MTQLTFGHSSRTYHFSPSASPLRSFRAERFLFPLAPTTRASSGRDEELQEARSPVKAFALKLRNFGRKFARFELSGKARRSISSTFPILLLPWASLVLSASSFFFPLPFSFYFSLTFHPRDTYGPRAATALPQGCHGAATGNPRNSPGLFYPGNKSLDDP